jgi:hypothetical protein
MKKYAAVVDVSPSEQLGDSDDDIFCVGVVLGLRSRNSFDQVGANCLSGKGMRLRKYAGSGKAYRKNLGDYMRALKAMPNPHVLLGAALANQRFIRHVGKRVWERANSPIPTASSKNKKGKDRVMLGGYKVDGQERAPFELLVDDLIVIGWLAYEIASLHGLLLEINRPDMVSLDIISDRLPNDRGEREANKGELLKATLQKLSGGIIDIVGVPDRPDFHQRDILVDNVAGLIREIHCKKNGAAYAFSGKELSFSRKDIRRSG